MTQNGPMDRLVRASLDTGIRRPSQGRWVAGVSGGLGASRQIDPVLFRVGFVLLALFSGLGITAYLLCWLLLPSDDDTVALDRALRQGDGGAITLLVIIAINLFAAVGGALGSDSGTVLGLVLLGGLVWLVVRRGDRSPQAAEPSPGAADITGAAPAAPPTTEAGAAAAPAQGPVVRPAPASLRAQTTRSAPPPETAPHPVAAGSTPTPKRPRPPQIPFLLTLVVAGLAIIAYPAATTLGAGLGRPWILGLAAMTLVVGGACIAAGLARRRASILEAASWIMALALVLSSTAVTNADGVGDQFWQPRTGVELSSEYSAGVGDATLDLTHLSASDLADVRITLSGGIGDLTVVLPEDIRTTVEADLGIGEISISDRTTSTTTSGIGGDIDPVTVGSGEHHLTVRIDAGIGDVSVETRPRTAPSPESELEGVQS